MTRRIGIDLGGTKIEGVLLDHDGRELDRERIASPRDDYEATVREIVALVGRLDGADPGLATVGVGVPGIISPVTGLMKNANSTWLIGHPFNRDLEAALGRPVRMENDANCLAMSEAVDGAGMGADVVFAAILGTGCGAGIVVHGRPLSGRNAVAGEWGHNPLPWPNDEERPGPPCHCGKSGCLETFLSGPAVAADHARTTGEALSAGEIARAAADGDAMAMATVDRLAERLARGLAMVVNILDPDVIVLGGGVSNIDQLYELVPPRLAAHVFSDSIDTPIRKAAHGDSSGVRGAAWLWN